MKHFDVVPISILEDGKIKSIYTLMMIYDSYSIGFKTVILSIKNLPQKYAIAAFVGLKTLTLTIYLKNNFNCLTTNSKLSYIKTPYTENHYIFLIEEDARNAANYLNDCLLAMEMIK